MTVTPETMPCTRAARGSREGSSDRAKNQAATVSPTPEKVVSRTPRGVPRPTCQDGCRRRGDTAATGAVMTTAPWSRDPYVASIGAVAVTDPEMQQDPGPCGPGSCCCSCQHHVAPTGFEPALPP